MEENREGEDKEEEEKGEEKDREGGGDDGEKEQWWRGRGCMKKPLQ